MAVSREGRHAVFDLFRMSWAGAELIGRRQRQRLDGMIGYARSHSPFYRELYADLPGGVPDLRITPLFIIFVGENVPGRARRYIETTFGCRSYEEYGSTENGVVAVQCRAGWLHYSADWYVLEPVDTRYRTVPAGTRSDTVLITNLTNRLMPLIRYDQGDCVVLKPGPCACGSPFPAIRVAGRTDDLLDLPRLSGTAGSCP
jgi:phenylacetate-coenzyme A ligase PaaK-like adenylate-forming protein